MYFLALSSTFRAPFSCIILERSQKSLWPISQKLQIKPQKSVKIYILNSNSCTHFIFRAPHSKAGISEMFEGHHGPITGLHCHTAAGPLDFSHLFVTSSFDWTVKLWSTKVRARSRTHFKGPRKTSRIILFG